MKTLNWLKLLFVASLILVLPLCGCADNDSAQKSDESVAEEVKQDADQAQKALQQDVNEAKEAGEADIEDKPQ